MDYILVVEPSEAVSENVKEAIKLRTDPLSATRLVTTPAQIKEKINAKMSADGRYLYNDQFSEVTVCDANGNNLVNNEYYSFIARDKDKLFMAKNNADTDVLEFSIPDKKFVEEVKEEIPSEQVITQEIPSQEVQQVVGPVQENTAEVDMPYEFNFVYENEDDKFVEWDYNAHLEKIAAMLGGRVAEKMYTGKQTSGASTDIAMATDEARRMLMKYGLLDQFSRRNSEKDDGDPEYH